MYKGIMKHTCVTMCYNVLQLCYPVDIQKLVDVAKDTHTELKIDVH